jgi:catechol 2,3-dioxygenase-like lactoylglutathione lyase family enzyme
MIQHVTRRIAPASLQACLRFYAVLGLRPVPAPPSLASRATWLAADGDAVVQLHLLYDEAAAPEAGHIALALPDLDTAVAELAGLGHPYEPRTAHWGARRGYVRDPAGHLVELMEAPPPAPE